MFLISKAASVGVVFILLTTGMPGPRPAPLRDEGRYRGKVDGVFGLRTRASIRGLQKAENLPVTGQLDTQTASKLGVKPEDRDETGYKAAKDKPSAYIEWGKGSNRTSKTQRKAVKAVATPESGDREKTLRDENENRVR